MNELEQYREELEHITQEMLGLLECRLNISKQIATYKYSHQMPIFQPEREQLLIEKLVGTGNYTEEKKAFLQYLFELSKQVQRGEIEKK